MPATAKSLNELLRVLIVNDSPEPVQGTRTVLESAGYSVEQATNMEEALHQVRETKPVVVVLGREIPGGNVQEICRQIKADEGSAHIPVLVIATEAAGEAAEQATSADGHLPSPLADQDLRERVDTYARISVLNRELIEANRVIERRQEELSTLNKALEQSRREALGLLEDALEARRQVEAMAYLLQDRDELLNDAGNLRGIGGWELDLNTQQVQWTPQTRILHEEEADEPITLERALGFYEPAGRAQLEKAINMSREKGTPWNLELPLHTAKGKRLWVRAVGQARFENGQAAKLVGVIIDVTARKKAEQERAYLNAQMVTAQKMESIGLLAGGIAHEFNNKLQTIIGFAEMSALNCETDSSLYAELETINKAAREAADLTRQLLAYASKQAAQPRSLDLNETVEHILELLTRTLGEHIVVEWDPGALLWPVHIDPTQVEQVMTNLALNARDAMPNGGTLFFSSRNVRVAEQDRVKPKDRPAGEYVRLVVRDTGQGIPPDVLGKIYDPFFTTKSQGKGTGLGLPSVWGIVRQNGGFLHTESTPGEGATFAVYLPRDPATTKAPPTAQPEGNETILVAEDEKTILDICQMHLGRLGYTVLAASTPSEAIRIAEKEKDRIHLLLTDVIMPEMNGRQLFNTLRAICPRLGVVYMSGYSERTLDEQGALGKDALFMSKPFGQQQLAETVRAALDDKPMKK